MIVRASRFHNDGGLNEHGPVPACKSLLVSEKGWGAHPIFYHESLGMSSTPTTFFWGNLCLTSISHVITRSAAGSERYNPDNGSPPCWMLNGTIKATESWLSIVIGVTRIGKEDAEDAVVTCLLFSTIHRKGSFR